ncbi:MAG: M14 family metallopeptidase [Candidatus Colwellbacteria bacterium]|nr:M14 family metallopeptidase [Candidatus Colwellbacteria bacterium]
MKTYILILAALVLIGAGGYFVFQRYSDGTRTEIPESGEMTADDVQPAGEEQTNERETQIGISVEGRKIVAYHYGSGNTELLFVGGIHGGYEWNTALVAYELMDYLEEHPDAVPENERVTVIPVLNPDGLNKTVGTAGRFTEAEVPSAADATVSGRFNANDVDLNRNFDCDWKTVGTWQNRTVSGGNEPFSEPESLAVRDYIKANTPDAVVVWYSAAGGVFASSCHNGVLSETDILTKLYADASGYPAYQSFDFYAVTGDMVNWLAKEEIPAISVLLSTHEDVEWAKNQAGIEALLEHYAE